MARAFCIPGIIFLTAALVLSFLVSISLPFLPALDIARTSFDQSVKLSNNDLTEVRYGVWSACSYESNERTCLNPHHGYGLQFSDSQEKTIVVINPSWTRGLAIHPVATGITFLAFVMSFSSHITVTLLCSLVSFFAALMTLIAFAVDIALFAYVRSKMGDLPNTSSHTNTAPGFWLTFVSLILLLLAGCTVCFGRRKDRMSTASSYPMTKTKTPFWRRLRPNRF